MAVHPVKPSQQLLPPREGLRPDFGQGVADLRNQVLQPPRMGDQITVSKQVADLRKVEPPRPAEARLAEALMAELSKVVDAPKPRIDLTA